MQYQQLLYSSVPSFPESWLDFLRRLFLLLLAKWPGEKWPGFVWNVALSSLQFLDQTRKVKTKSSDCMVLVRPLNPLSHRGISPRISDYCHSVLDKCNCRGHDSSSMVLESLCSKCPKCSKWVGISLCQSFLSQKLDISGALLYLPMTCDLSVGLSTATMQTLIPCFVVLGLLSLTFFIPWVLGFTATLSNVVAWRQDECLDQGLLQTGFPPPSVAT